MLASRPAAATLLRPVLWVGSMTDMRPAADIGPGDENVLGEASVSQLVRVAALAVVTLNAVLAAIELGRLALATASAGYAGLALLATVCVLPLHLRHVVYGLRGVRPPYDYWTLTALGIVNMAATAVIGQVWLMNFALFAVSALIVLPARWAVPAFALIGLSTGPLAGPSDEFSGSYLIFSVAWRSITLFSLVWLVAAYRQLAAARREFRDQAVVRDRLRIQSKLRRGLGRALESIVARSSRASAAAGSRHTHRVEGVEGAGPRVAGRVIRCSARDHRLSACFNPRRARRSAGAAGDGGCGGRAGHCHWAPTRCRG